jgi:hypothetical protein
MGYSQDWLGRFGPGFFIVGLAGFLAAGLLLQVSRQWQAQDLPALGAAQRRQVEAITPT